MFFDRELRFLLKVTEPCLFGAAPNAVDRGADVPGGCRPVNSHSTKHYSPPIQKAVIHIESDPAQDLNQTAMRHPGCNLFFQAIQAAYRYDAKTAP